MVYALTGIVVSKKLKKEKNPELGDISSRNMWHCSTLIVCHKIYLIIKGFFSLLYNDWLVHPFFTGLSVLFAGRVLTVNQRRWEPRLSNQVCLTICIFSSNKGGGDRKKLNPILGFKYAFCITVDGANLIFTSLYVLVQCANCSYILSDCRNSHLSGLL